MNPIKQLAAIESLAHVQLDAITVARLQTLEKVFDKPQRKPITFYIPGFKTYAIDISIDNTPVSCQQVCGNNTWPAVSITGASCQLQCDHCKAQILTPMFAATTPAQLWRVVNERIDHGAQGMLLTGGSNKRNEIEYQAFLPVIGKIKQHHPNFTIVCHTALMDNAAAMALEASGVDVAMMDVIGAQDTITQVYHLKRSVADFEKTLAALTATSMRVVPHIVLGLHYGRLLGEWHALNIIQRHAVHGVVMVVVMPYYAPAKRPFQLAESRQFGRFFYQAKKQLGDLPLYLGCARPPGRVKAEIDIYATLAGFQGIAYPAEGVAELASAMGRNVSISTTCCSLGTVPLSRSVTIPNNHIDTLMSFVS